MGEPRVLLLRPRAPQMHRWHRMLRLDVFRFIKVGIIPIEIRRYISRQFAAIKFFQIRHQHAPLQFEPARGVDRMRDIRVQLGPHETAAAAAIWAGHVAIFVQSRPALITEPGTQMVLLAAAPAAVAQFSAGHRQEKPIISFDQFHIANDEGVIESERAKRAKPAASAVFALL